MHTILVGDVHEQLKTLPDNSIHCCVTSPPYWGLRDYGHDGQIGLEKTPEAYVAQMVEVFREVRRVLKDDGTLWLNLGDSYSGGKTGRADHESGDASSRLGPNRDGIPRGTIMGPVIQRSVPTGYKPKDLVGIPWRVAFALQADGWWLRQDIIWHKPNPMPESVTDRCTKAHEYVFLLTKSARYYYDNQSIMEAAQYGEQHANKSTSWGINRKHPNKDNVANYAHKGDNHTSSKMADGSYGRNKRSVWSIATKPSKGAHFAVMPEALVEPCIRAGSKLNDTVLDPFLGSGTTLAVAKRLGRNGIGIELNPEYVNLAENRIGDATTPLF